MVGRTMAVTILADSLDELPEIARASAKQEGGKFVAAMPADHQVENAKALRSTLSSERGRNKLLAEKAGEFGWKLSEDGSKWLAEGMSAKDAGDAIEAKRTGALRSSKEIDDYKAEMARSWGEKETGWTKERTALESEITDSLFGREAAAAITKHGGNAALLLPFMEKRAKVEKSADGKRRVVIYDEHGRQRFSTKSANGALMDLNEWVEELRGSHDFKQAFSTQVSGGSGATSQSGGSGRVGNQQGDGDKLSPKEMLIRGRERAAAGGA